MRRLTDERESENLWWEQSPMYSDIFILKRNNSEKNKNN